MIAVALLQVAGFASAGWVPITTSDTGTVYADLSAKTRDRQVVTIWTLFDHQVVQREAGDAYLSSKGQWQIDCTGAKMRQTFHVIYSGHMGSGSTLWSGSLGKTFEPVVPGSTGESLFEAACR